MMQIQIYPVCRDERWKWRLVDGANQVCVMGHDGQPLEYVRGQAAKFRKLLSKPCEVVELESRP